MAITYWQSIKIAAANRQKELLKDISSTFKVNSPLSIKENGEYDHGRFETRRYSILSADPTTTEEIIGVWNGLKTIVEVESIRVVKDKKTTETLNYSSDEEERNELYFSHLVGGHWGVEKPFTLAIGCIF